MGHRYRLDYGKYSLPQKLMVGVMAAVGRLIPLKWIMALQRRMAKKDRKKKTKRLYYSNYQPDFLYVTLDREWCPKGWHHVLTQVYGDYRTLPPKDKRKPSHSTIEILVDGGERAEA